MEHTPFQQIDDTTVRVNGKNQYSQILCNPYYTAFFTVPRKDRLTILDLLLCGRERTYRFDLKAFCLMSDFNVAKKVTNQLLNLTEDKEISEAEMQSLLEKVFKKGEGKNTKTRIMEAAAIAAYHQQTTIPVVNILLADDAPQAETSFAASARPQLSFPFATSDDSAYDVFKARFGFLVENKLVGTHLFSPTKSSLKCPVLSQAERIFYRSSFKRAKLEPSPNSKESAKRDAKPWTYTHLTFRIFV